MGFMWAEDRQKLTYLKAINDVENSFEEIFKKKKLGFSRRENQRDFAVDIMNCIKDNQILLVQAGVGIGKSMGYIVPIFCTHKNITKFDKIIISTSSIALQQQLLTDINFVSKLLKVGDLKVEVAKGVNNYVCLKALSDYETRNIPLYLRKKLENLKSDMEQKNSVDKSDLIDVGEKVWRNVQLKNNLSCSNCNYSRVCLYKQHLKDLERANIIVTNHAYFVNAAKSDNEIISNADMYVFDEAHELEDAIRNVDENKYMLIDFKDDIYSLIKGGFLNDEKSCDIAYKLITDLRNLFCKIKYDSINEFNKNTKDEKISITDCDKISVNGAKYVKDIKIIINKFSYLIKKLTSDRDIKFNRNISRIINKFYQYCDVFYDLSTGKNSKNIYWADFFEDNKINLGFVNKNDSMAIERIFGSNKPVVCTSATLLDANGSYNYFKEWLHLNELSGRSIVDGRVYESPFNYKNNSIFYYDTSVSNPNNYNEYIYDLVNRINDLIIVTEGKVLVLFTAKSTMKKVYDAIVKKNIGYNIMMQGQMDNTSLCKKFEQDTNSCLFATGSFWEGIDIKGKALSNVIITRLPFSVVDAITESKASKYSSDEAFRMVYLNDMVQKMAQGCGRLIRNKNDKGIICCLDSRVLKYLDSIKKCTPYVKYTDNIDDIIKFSNKYIKKL